VEIEQEQLPGIGLKHVLITRNGRRVGVVAQRNGRHDLVVYAKDDPGSAVVSVALTAEEADALAELLGTPRVAQLLSRLHRQVIGMISEQVPIVADSPYVGRTLGATQARTRTGASIIGVLRGSEVIASPGPDFVFEPGDMVIVVGTRDGTQAVADILTGG
jgi:TrkA domain protein